jgi:hypothetical protein
MTAGSTFMAALIVLLTLIAGSRGAALAVVSGEALITLWMFMRARNVLPMIRPWRAAVVVALLAVAGPALSCLLTAGFPVAGGAAVAGYGLAVLMLGGLTRSDVRYLRESLA